MADLTRLRRFAQVADARRSVTMTVQEWTLVGEALDGLLCGGLCEEEELSRAAFVKLRAKALGLKRRWYTEGRDESRSVPRRTT